MDFEEWVDAHFANSSMDLDKLREAYDDIKFGEETEDAGIQALHEEIKKLRKQVEQLQLRKLN